MILGFADALRGHIREDLNSLADAMSTGAAKDFSQYQHMVGQVHGLALAESHLLRMIEAYEDLENADS